MSPNLFDIFINDPLEGLHSEIYVFRDDFKKCKVINTKGYSILLQMDLGKLEAWAQKWQMTFKIEICKVMHIEMKNPCQENFLLWVQKKWKMT